MSDDDEIHQAELRRVEEIAAAVNAEMPDATESERFKEFKRRLLSDR